MGVSAVRDSGLWQPQEQRKRDQRSRIRPSGLIRSNAQSSTWLCLCWLLLMEEPERGARCVPLLCLRHIGGTMCPLALRRSVSPLFHISDLIHVFRISAASDHIHKEMCLQLREYMQQSVVLVGCTGPIRYHLTKLQPSALPAPCSLDTGYGY